MLTSILHQYKAQQAVEQGLTPRKRRVLLIYALNYLKQLYLDLLACVTSVSVLFSVRRPDEEFSAFWLGEGTKTLATLALNL